MPRKRAAGPADKQQLKQPERGARPDDVDRLPRRFRDYILRLERAASEMTEMLGENAGSPVSIETYSDSPKRYLKPDARVCFQTANGRVEVSLEKRRGHGGLAVSSPDGRLIILAEVSNEIGVKVRDH